MKTTKLLASALLFAAVFGTAQAPIPKLWKP